MALICLIKLETIGGRTIELMDHCQPNLTLLTINSRVVLLKIKLIEIVNLNVIRLLFNVAVCRMIYAECSMV